MPGAVKDYPFGAGVAAFKIGGRMFALVPLDGSRGSVNLKCDPEPALELRARHWYVRPGYHQNKRHRNTVELDGSIDAQPWRRTTTAVLERAGPPISAAWHGRIGDPSQRPRRGLVDSGESDRVAAADGPFVQYRGVYADVHTVVLGSRSEDS
jgi:hypothetical protein